MRTIVDADTEPSTSSPPSQPVISASPTATHDAKMAAPEGMLPTAFERIHQLIANRTTTMTLPKPCQRPIAFARVFVGIAHQSIAPNTAASSPPMIPARISQKEYGWELSVGCQEISHVESQRSGQKAKRKNNEHLMHRMPRKFGFAFYCAVPLHGTGSFDSNVKRRVARDASADRQFPST